MRRLVLIVFLLGNVLGIKGQNIDAYILTAAEKNPALKAKYSQYLSALERVPQVGGLPDPELSLGFFLRPMERFMGNQVGDITLMQMFPWFGTLDAAKSEAAMMAKMKYEAFREERNQIIYNVKESWYELYRLEKEKKFLEDNLEILQTFEKLALSRYMTGGEIKSNPGKREPIRPEIGNKQTPRSGGMDMGGNQPGKTPQPGMGQMGGEMSEMGTSGTGMVDVLRVQMQIKETERELQLLEDEIKTQKVKFNVLLNQPVEEPVTIADTVMKAVPPVSMEATLDTILQQNPMIKMTEFEEEAYEAMEQMQKRMGLPMIGIGANYMLFSPRPGAETHMNGKNMFMPMVAVSLPIYRRKYSAAVREASLLRQSAVEERQHIANELKLSFHEIVKDMKDAERRITLYAELLVMSEQALNILTTDYKTAGKNFEEVLRMRQQVLQYQLEKINSIVRYNTALAMLESLRTA